MSTRGEIGFLNKDGTVNVIYNHYDNYLDRTGLDLITNWNSEERAKEAVLEAKYNNNCYQTYSSVEEWLDNISGLDREFVYLWIDKWYFIECDKDFNFKDDWKEVSEELKKEIKEMF